MRSSKNSSRPVSLKDCKNRIRTLATHIQQHYYCPGFYDLKIGFLVSYESWPTCFVKKPWPNPCKNCFILNIELIEFELFLTVWQWEKPPYWKRSEEHVLWLESHSSAKIVWCHRATPHPDVPEKFKPHCSYFFATFVILCLFTSINKWCQTFLRRFYTNFQPSKFYLGLIWPVNPIFLLFISLEVLFRGIHWWWLFNLISDP